MHCRGCRRSRRYILIHVTLLFNYHEGLLPSPPVSTAEQRKKLLGILLRVGVFALIAALGYYFVFPLIIAFLGAPVFVISTLGTFAAAAVANTLAVRIYERGSLSDVGL